MSRKKRKDASVSSAEPENAMTSAQDGNGNGGVITAEADLETISGVTRVSARELGISPEGGGAVFAETDKDSAGDEGSRKPPETGRSRNSRRDGGKRSESSDSSRREKSSESSSGEAEPEVTAPCEMPAENARSKTRGRSSVAGKGKRKAAPDPLETRFFRLSVIIIAAGILWLIYKCIYPYAEDRWFNRFTEPALYQSNSHYTEFHLKLNIIPRMLEERGIKLPYRTGEGVTLTGVTAGPGSTLNMHFDLSPEFAAEHNPDEAYMHMCRSRYIREKILTAVDSYRLIYTVNGEDFAELEIEEENCSGIMYD